MESAHIKQEAHAKSLPEVAERVDEAAKKKQQILDIFKAIKEVKLRVERMAHGIE